MATLPKTLAQFNQLKDAEEYFHFFGIEYDPHIVNVNRLHILRKFSKFIQDVDSSQPDPEVLAAYAESLQSAYSVFLTSTSVEQKLFKVFHDQPKNVVMLSDIEVE